MSNIGLFGQIVYEENEIKASYCEAMKFFEKTPKTEAAFWIRFQTMPLKYLDAIIRHIHSEDEWKLFREISKFWKLTS